jgi:hypothetical protein
MMKDGLTRLVAILRQEKALLDDYLQLLADERSSICRGDWCTAAELLDTINGLARKGTVLEARRLACQGGFSKPALSSSGTSETVNSEDRRIEEHRDQWQTARASEEEIGLLRRKIEMLISGSLELIESGVGHAKTHSNSADNSEKS